MVYLGILVTRKYMRWQKILSKSTHFVEITKEIFWFSSISYQISQHFLPNYRVTQKKSIPLFEVLWGAQVFAKQLNRYIFGFPAKYLTNLDQYFQRFHCQKKDICNSAVFSPTALLQISFVQIILRLPVDISLIENRIYYHNQYFEGSFYIYCSNQL